MTKFKKIVFSSLLIIPTAIPMALVVSCGSNENLKVNADNIIKKIKEKSNEKFVLYIGSTACPYCRVFVSGSPNYSENNNIYNVKNMTDHKGEVNYIKSKGVWRKFIEKKPSDINVYEINDIALANEELPFLKNSKREYIRNDESAKDIRKILEYLKNNYSISIGTPTVIFFNKGTVKELFKTKNIDDFIDEIEKYNI